MALRYKDLYDYEISRNLTQEELEEIKKCEEYVDMEIRQQWHNGTICIDLSIANFSFNPWTKEKTNHSPIIKSRMFAALQERFKKADWDCKIQTGMSLAHEKDLWILTPKTDNSYSLIDAKILKE